MEEQVTVLRCTPEGHVIFRRSQPAFWGLVDIEYQIDV